MTKVQSEEFVEFGIPQYFKVLKRRWLPVGLTVLLCTALSALIAARNNRSVYEASGKLLFQSRDPQSELTGVGADVSKFEIDAVGRNNPLQNQASLLVSGLLLEEVIQTLDMRNSLGELLSFQEVRSGLTVKQVPDTDILSVSYQSVNPKFSENFVNTLMRAYLRFNSKNQKYNVDLARQFIRKQIPQAKTEFERTSQDLRDFKAQNNVVTLDSKALEVASFNDQTLQDSRNIQRKLKSSEARIAEIRQQLFKLSGTQNLSAVDLSKLNDSDIVQSTLSDIENVEAELEIQSEQYTSDHPVIIDLQLKLKSLNSVLETQVSSLLGKSTSVNAKNLQLSDLHKQLLEELSKAEIERESLREEDQVLSAQKSSLNQGISKFANLEKAQKDLEQNVETSRTRYFELLEKLEKLDLTEATLRESNQVQIIESAITPTVPLEGFKTKIVLAGALLGLSLGLGLALLLDILDSKIKTLKQLEQLVGQPILGTVPLHERVATSDTIPEFDNFNALETNPTQVITLSSAPSSVYTAYQRLYVNVALLRNEKIPHILGVTSGVSQEGKSEISANLAATIAQAGQQVLLVDANFQNPAQHQFWRLDNNAGFSSVLHDSVSSRLVSKKVAPNLDVIVSGPVTNNISITSNYSSFLRFINEVSPQYDCVIFDTGSVLSDPDAISLGKVCEGVLLVASLHNLQISEALKLKEMLSQAKLPILGVIANKFGKNEAKEEPRTLGSNNSLIFSPANQAQTSAPMNIMNAE